MKAILKFTLACMVCLEILSPLMIGMLNSNKANAQNNGPVQLRVVEQIGASVDNTSDEITYADSKSMMIKE